MKNSTQSLERPYHVMATGRDDWAIHRNGAKKFRRIYKVKQEAIEAALSLSEKDKEVLFIHDVDGEIEEIVSLTKTQSRVAA